MGGTKLKRIGRSFAGEHLVASPATIIDISIDTITAYANYQLDHIILNYPNTRLIGKGIFVGGRAALVFF
jgi:hypothetical protein